MNVPQYGDAIRRATSQYTDTMAKAAEVLNGELERINAQFLVRPDEDTVKSEPEHYDGNTAREAPRR